MVDFDDELIAKKLRKISSEISALDDARLQVEKGEFDQALALFKEGLGGGVGNEESLKLRESIEKLVNEHPPAREVFTKIRDDLEAKMIKGSSSRWRHEQWTEINAALGDCSRELTLLEKLNSPDSSADEFEVFQTVRMNLQKFLEQRNYQLFAPYLDKLGWMFLADYSNYESEIYFRRQPDEPLDMSELLLTQVLEEGPMLYEACLGLDRVETANEIARKILAISNDGNTYRALLIGAQRAQSGDQLTALMKEAEKQLTSHEWSAIRNELGL